MKVPIGLLLCAGAEADTGISQDAKVSGAAATTAAADVEQPQAAAGAEDDEFDYSAELDAAAADEAVAVDATAAAASPQQSPRASLLPPLPPPVDDSAAHVQEYLSTVCTALLESLPEGALPDRIQPAQVRACHVLPVLHRICSLGAVPERQRGRLCVCVGAEAAAAGRVLLVGTPDGVSLIRQLMWAALLAVPVAMPVAVLTAAGAAEP